MGLRAIAVYKFCKSLLLVIVALGALQLSHPEVVARVQRWVDAFAASSDRRAVQHVLGLITGLSPQRLELVAVGALLYTVLFTVEGVGLWLGTRWGAYLTVIATSLFVPVEVFALARHLSAPRAAALVVNLVVVAYLVHHLRIGRSSTERYQ
ncbi:MAG TPA: DUF2127 domain-containing protein [Gemmatimonadales bacterium]|nr:DUF2127 domain-containing protein [Gemmatimonadales bacterium]